MFANPSHAFYLSRPKDVPGFPHVFTIGTDQLASVRRYAVKRRARYRDFPPEGSGSGSRSRSLPGFHPQQLAACADSSTGRFFYCFQNLLETKPICSRTPVWVN